MDKYIGIIHEYGESTWMHCDCCGLMKLFYATEGFKETLDDHKPIGTAETYKKQSLRILRYLLKNLDKVTDHNELQWGDVVVFHVSGELHCGVFVGYGKVLAMSVPVVYGESRSTIYKKHFWRSQFVAGFRSRKEDTQ